MHLCWRPWPKLVMLALDSVIRFQPRFVQWRTTRPCCGVSGVRQLDASEVPSALWDRLAMRNSIWRAPQDGGFRTPATVLLRGPKECRRNSAPGFPSTVLGL